MLVAATATGFVHADNCILAIECCNCSLSIIDILAHLKEGDSYGAKQEQAPA